MSQNIFAAALFEHIVQPYVATQLIYDSNVLRLPKNFTPEMSGNKTTTSSFIKQIKAGLAVNWQFSQQQVIADVSVNQNWYSTYNELNYTGHELLGQWNWQIGQKLKGELSYKNRSILGNFSQINRLLIDNLENKQTYLANGNYEILPDWYLRTQLTHSIKRFTAESRQFSDLNETSKEFGLRYLNPLENMFGFRLTITDGKYPNRSDTSIFDNAYTRTTYGVEGNWNYSIKTRLRGEAGYASQEFKHIKSRNFSNFVARGSILWDATSKSSLFLEAWREISSADSLTASFVITHGIALTPKWTWSETPRIQLELPMSYEQQANVGNVGLSNDPTIISPQSNLSNIRLNLNYTPIPNIEMTAFANYQCRRSSNPLHSYTDEMLGFTMKVSF